MNIHEKIKLLRQLKGWSQEDVADKLGMSPNGYGSIERGDTDVSLSRLEKIAAVFGVNLTELVSFGDKISYNQTGNTNHQNWYGNSEITQLELKHELEKKEILLAERNKEIAHLNEIINLLKRPSESR